MTAAAIATTPALQRGRGRRRAPRSDVSFFRAIVLLEARTRAFCDRLAPGVLETAEWSAARAFLISAPVFAGMAALLAVLMVH